MGWGKEDLELRVRLRNWDVRPVSAAHAEGSFRPWHEAAEDKKINAAWQTELKARYKGSREQRRPRGLDGHPGPRAGGGAFVSTGKALAAMRGRAEFHRRRSAFTSTTGGPESSATVPRCSIDGMFPPRSSWSPLGRAGRFRFLSRSATPEASGGGNCGRFRPLRAGRSVLTAAATRVRAASGGGKPGTRCSGRSGRSKMSRARRSGLRFSVQSVYVGLPSCREGRRVCQPLRRRRGGERLVVGAVPPPAVPRPPRFRGGGDRPCPRGVMSRRPENAG